MGRDHTLDLLTKARTQYRWAIANIIMAGVCVVIALGAFAVGSPVAGVLVIVVSFALVVNADAHRRRGVAAQEERAGIAGKKKPPECSSCHHRLDSVMPHPAKHSERGRRVFQNVTW